MTNKKPLSLESRMKSGKLLKAKTIISKVNTISDYDERSGTINWLLKNHNQSYIEDKEFLEKSELYRYMTAEPNRVFWKDELRWHFEESDRAIRKDLAELASHAPVVALSSTKGYRVVKITEDRDDEALQADLEDIEHQLNELMSRAANLKARMKPLMACRAEIKARLGK